MEWIESFDPWEMWLYSNFELEIFKHKLVTDNLSLVFEITLSQVSDLVSWSDGLSCLVIWRGASTTAALSRVVYQRVRSLGFQSPSSKIMSYQEISRLISCHFEIWLAPQQQCCWGASQISEW